MPQKKPILLFSPFYAAVAERFINDLSALDETETSMTWLNSNGGYVTHGYSMITALNERNAPNNALVTGNASSMGAQLLLFFDNVEAVESAMFILHRAAAFIENDENKKETIGVNKMLRAKLEKVVKADVFKSVTGFSLDEMFSLDKRINITLNAKEAKKIGLIQKIRKLNTREMTALTDNDFTAFAPDNVEEPKANINPKIDKKMTVAELRAKYPVLLAQVEAEEKAKELDRVKAYLVFNDIDPNACKAGIESGENPSQTFMAEMQLKAIGGVQAQRTTADNPGDITTTPETPKTEEQTHNEELAAFTAKVMGEEVEK